MTHLSSYNSLVTRLVYEKISIIPYLRHMQEIIVFGVCKWNNSIYPNMVHGSYVHMFNGRCQKSMEKNLHLLLTVTFDVMAKFLSQSLCCLMTPGLRKDIQRYVWPYYQSRHQATSKMGRQPGDCRWPPLSSSGKCVCMYKSTYSLITPEGIL